MSARSLLALLAVLLLASPLLAQTANPPNQQVVLTAGKSTNVKLDAGGCNPSWTAVSGDTGVASVSPEDVPKGKKRSFKITADPGAIGSSTTVTITLTDDGCLDGPTEFVFQVYVVMDAKGVERRFERGDKGAGLEGVKKRVAAFRKAAKQIEKELKQQQAELLKQVDAGEVTLDPFGAGLSEDDRMSLLPDDRLFLAMLYGIGFEYLAFQSLFGQLIGTMGWIRNDGYTALSLYGYVSLFFAGVPLMPMGFLAGGCGAYDNGVSAAMSIYLGSLLKLQGLTKAFYGQLRKRGLKSGAALSAVLLPFLAVVGNLAFFQPILAAPSPFLAEGMAPTYDPPLSVATVRGLNLPVGPDADNGRFVLMGTGRSSPGSPPVSAVFLRLDANGDAVGDPLEGPEVTVTAPGTWQLVFPPAGEEADLGAGLWRIQVTQGDEQVLQDASIPTL